MTSRIVKSPFGRATVLTLGLALLVATQSSADTISIDGNKSSTDGKPSADSSQPTKLKSTKKAVASKTKKKKQPIIHSLKVDPKAQHVALFDGLANNSLNVKVVAQNSLSGNLFITNNSKTPLTVDMPESFVAVQILRQFGAGGGGRAGMGGMGGMGGMQSMGMGMGGGMGGGMMGGGMGGGMGGMGGGMFSVPPERTVQVPVHSVCLEHGKNDPDSDRSLQVDSDQRIHEGRAIDRSVEPDRN